MKKLLLVAAVLLGGMPAARAADAIGRLFFTPEQRAQLDLVRSQKIVASQVKDEPIPEFVTYNGIVRRSDGKATVWVNNKSMSDSELRTAQPLTGRIDRSGQILLQTPQQTSAGAIRLKVGQSAELQSGQVAESYTARKEVVLQKAAAAPKNNPDTRQKAETATDRPSNDAGKSREEIGPPRPRADDASGK